MLDAHYKGDIDISDYWAIGDSRTESINEIPSGTTGETQPAQDIELVIIGMNHDDLKTPANNITKAAITVQTKNCLKSTGYVSPGYDGSMSWSNSPRRTWCNNDFINALSTLKGLIKPVVKLSNRYGEKAASIYQETTEDYVFFLSQWELWGEQKLSSSFGKMSADGVQYEYMQTVWNRIKNNDWWTRSSTVYGGISRFIYNDTHDKLYYNYYGTDYGKGIAPAFCL